MIDKKLTEQLQQWLEAPEQERSTEIGAMLLRRLTRNLIFAQNFERNPSRHMKMAAYQLGKFLPRRLAEVTHEQVKEMSARVAVINREHQLSAPLPGSDKTAAKKRIAKTEEFVKGKRPDHDQLPEEIQALYAENLSVMQNMRTLHAQLVLLTLDESKAVCPDNDRYPFVKEIIALDEQYHANWQKYDEYPTVE